MRRLAVIALLAVGCTSAASTDGAFTLMDGSIDGPGTIAKGSSSLQVTNVGEFNHTLVVTDSEGHVLAATDVVAPGESVTLDVDLSGGQYMVSCRLVTELPDGTILDHYEAGMFRNVNVDD